MRHDAIPVDVSHIQPAILKNLPLDDKQLENIIPRLNEFPMQGQTITVAGHDDG